ncbi:DUF4198 domain-containing protein [Persicitalea jodogahamensis]|uniref:DUF4198 domain-containing protein n=1 Tax=Persicitalea jodogahamensis TaxID=402147 RepID=A0A8J3DBK5_9BACT|nr:DUF4198 domain-containing protein [Persicitalea jodogahamensis]GHB79933.1 hypothetical protein GCM10007390_37650 [Persicitalea jodogahamensis]
MKLRIFALIFISTASIALAHEFWIVPEDFFPELGKKLNWKIQVGEDYMGERWGGGSRRIERLRLFTANGQEDLTGTIEQSDQQVEAPAFTLEKSGTQMLVLETNNSFIELEPVKFEAYLKEDGLQLALDYRQKNNEQQKVGREFYRRCAKTIIQVGEQKNGLPTKPTGLDLDIIPLQNPYAMKRNSALTCRILYNQKPLANAMVRCWRRVNGKTEVEFQQTDSKGEATFELTKKGKAAYMLSSVHMVRLADSDKADWQSLWGSVTFGMK